MSRDPAFSTLLRALVLGTLVLAAGAAPPTPEQLIAYRDECAQTGAPMRIVERFGYELNGLDLRGVRLAVSPALREISLRGAELDGVMLEGATLEGVDLSSCRLRGVVARGARLQSCQFRGSLLDHVDLEGAVLDGSSFHQARLVQVRLVGASLRGVSFFRAELEGADFGGAQLARARFDHARLSDIAGITPSDLNALDQANQAADLAAQSFPPEARARLPLRWSHVALWIAIAAIGARWAFAKYPGRAECRVAAAANALSTLTAAGVALAVYVSPPIDDGLRGLTRLVVPLQLLIAGIAMLAALRHAVRLAWSSPRERPLLVGYLAPAALNAMVVAIDSAAWAARWGALILPVQFR